MATKKHVPAYLTERPQFNYAALDAFLSQPPSAAEAPVEPRGMGRAVADTGLSFGQGAVQGVRMLTDLGGADNAVSAGLRTVEDYIGGLKSAQAKADQQEAAAILKAAEGAGILDQVIAGAKAFGVAPVQTLAQAAGTSIPTLATALIPGVGPAAAGARMGAALGMGAGQGAGNVKSSIYDEVRAAPLEGETPEQTEARAVAAQEYAGKNSGQIALGAGLGAWAGRSGIEGAAERLMHGTTRATPGVVKRVGIGAVAEGIPELAQGGQEKFATNTALANEGFDVDPMSGVVANATMEGLAGFGMGAAFALPKPGDVLRADKVPERGPMTRALNEGIIEQAAKKVDAGAPLPPEPGMAGAAAPLAPAPSAAPVAQPAAAPAAATAPPPVVAPPVDTAPIVAPAPPADAAAARAQREADRPPEPTGEVLPGDILSKSGQPWKSMQIAMREQARHPGAEIVRVAGGLVIRNTQGASDAQPGVDQPAAVPAGAADGAGVEPGGSPGAERGDRGRTGRGVDATPVAPVPGGGTPVAVGGGTGPDVALTDPVARAKRAWADAVARGESADVLRSLNDAITEAKSKAKGEAPAAAPAAELPMGQEPGGKARVVRVNDVEYTLTPEQRTEMERVEAAFKVRFDAAKDQYERTKNNPPAENPDVGLKSAKERFDAEQKALGMQLSAERRRIVDALTPKERKAKAEIDARLRTGNSVQTPEGLGVVTGNNFGRVRVEVNGQTRTFPRADVTKTDVAPIQPSPAQAPAAQAPEARKPDAAPAAPAAVPGAGTAADVEADGVKPAPGGAVMPAGLIVTFGGKSYPVESINDAQEKWVAFRDSTGAGVSEVGNGVRVTDGAGRFVARISYNGRAWNTEDDGTGSGTVIAEAPQDAAAPAVTQAPAQAEAPGAAAPEDNTIDPFTLDKAALNRRLDQIVAADEAPDLTRAFMVLRKRYMAATGKPSIPPAGSRAVPMYPETSTSAQPAPASESVVAQQAGPSEAAPKRTEARRTAKHPQTVMGSRLLAQVSISLDGLHPSLLSEFSERFETARKDRYGRPMMQWRNPMIPGVGLLFRRSGTTDRSRIAQTLEDYGYLPPGTFERDYKEAGEQAKDLIRAALNRDEVKTQDEIEADAIANQEAERQAYYAEVDAESAAELEAERAAIMAGDNLTTQELDALTDEDLFDGQGTTDTEASMRAMGFTEQEIADELAKEAAARAAKAGAQKDRQDEARGARPAAEDRGAAARPAGQEGLKRPPVAEGDRIRFTSNDGTVIDGMAVQVLDTSGGNYRIKIRTAEPAPQGGGNISRTVYSQDGTFEPLADEPLLTAQTTEDLQAKADREESATKAAASQKAAEQERLRKEAEARDLKARADATVDDFQLGQDANRQMSGMGDMFADAPATPAPQAAQPEAAAEPVKAKEGANDRDSFTLQRLNRDTNQMEPVTFTRGEYVRASLIGSDQSDFGEIDGISQARREYSVNGLWHPMGTAYKAERPAPAVKTNTEPLSKTIEKVNKKYGQGLTDADKVPPPTKTPTVDAHMELFKAVRAGTATPDEFKAMYRRVRDGKDAIVAELNTSTKDELLKDVRGYIGSSPTKGAIVEAIYDSMLRRYALGKDYGPSSWSPFQDGGLEGHKKRQAAALSALVEGQTAESLAQYAAELKAEFDATMAARTARLEAIKDPKTLDDFRSFVTYHLREGKTDREIRFMLTPEQRANLDTLNAEYTRGQRTAAKDEQRTAVRVAGQTVDGEIIATKHTRDGHDLYVVRLAERVSTEDYRTLLDGAKRIGGTYSSYRGNGAVPGFQFRTREAAQAFQKLAQGDKTAAVDAAKERRDAFQDDRSQSAAERLTEMADRLEERADESLGRERQANTERRARFAASAEAAAQSDKALAKTMRNIAGAIEAGTAKFLDSVRQKVQVELLQTYVRSAKDSEIRAKHDSYHEQEKRKGEPPTGETADYAEFPTFTAYRSDLASLGRQLLDVDGTKLFGQRLMKVADDVSDAYLAFAKEPGNLFRLSTFSVRSGEDVRTAIFRSREVAERAIKRSGLTAKAIAFQEKRGVHRIIMSPSLAMEQGIWKGDGDKRITLDPDFAAELVEKMGRANRRGAKVSVPWQFENAYDRRKALARMGIETGAEFRAALREFIGLREQAAAPDKVKQMERAMIGRRNDGLDFFPTPEETADAMVAAADIQPGMRVLEPSAGMGHIAERIRATEVEPDVGEVSTDRRELLEAKGFNVVAQDFMGLQEGGYDRILMNPPFSEGRDIQHVRHAYDLLKPGGRLVALMGESAFTNQNKRATEFREWLESVGGTEEKLPEGTFNDPSLPVNTGANARMVVIDRPGAEPSTQFSRAQDTPRVQTDTPAFREWFGDSKVVDAQGRPLVVYHGTNKDIAAFEPRRGAIWFAVDHLLSDKFVGGGRQSIGRKPGKGAVMYPVYLRINNPLDLTDMGLGDVVSMADILEQAGAPHDDAALAKIAQANLDRKYAFVTPALGDPVAYLVRQYKTGKRLSNLLDDPTLIEALKAVGVDGLKLTEEYEIGPKRATLETMSETYAVFDPEQIKSATGNTGAFDGSNPDIRYSRGDTPRGLSLDEAEAIVGAVREANQTAPPMIVLESVDQAPSALLRDIAEAGASNDVEAAYHEGKVYVFAPHLKSMERAMFVIAHHELRHHGMRSLEGRRLSTTLAGMVMSNPKLRDAARAKMDAGLAKDMIQGAEEALADMDVAEVQALKGWPKVLAAVRNWLRGMASRLRAKGHMALADAIDPKDWTDADVAGFVARAEAVSKGGRAKFGTDGTVFQRPPRSGMADMAGALTAPTQPAADAPRAADMHPAAWQKRGKVSAQDLVNTKGGVFDFNRMGETKQDRMRTVVNGGRPFFLAALTRDQIADVWGKEIPQVKDYDSMTRAMENERSKRAQDAETVYEEWSKLDADTNQVLAGIMADATLFSVNPDGEFTPNPDNDPVAELERERIHQRISKEYESLPAAARKVFGAVKGFHIQTLLDLKQALLDRIERQVEAGAARDAAMADIRLRFDKYIKGGPYFPLSRFGDYLVVANREEDGERVVASYETAGEQQAAARRLQDDGFAVKLKTAKTYTRADDGSAGKFIGDVLTTIDGLSMDDVRVGAQMQGMKAALMDDVNQLFIRALPDLSYRKHFAHRKGTAGFSSDMMRGFASSAFHSASHLARLNHGDKMTFALRDAYSAIENVSEGDFNEQSQVLNELAKRHDAALNPNTHPIASMMNALGFVMYLGLSPAAGLINMLQVPMVALPWMGGKYGFGRVSSVMARSYKDIMAAPMNKSSGFNAAESLKLTPAERAAISELQDEGIIDLTQAHDLASATGLDTGNVARSKAAFAMARAMKIVGWTFHVPEVMNRQVTALAAYRLEVARGATPEAAKEAAREAIKRTQFDYSASNRARFMQGNVARVVTQFKQYSQNMTYLLGRAAQQALKGESPEVRAIARKQLVATLGVTFAMAGTMGLPGLGFAASIIGALVNGLDDDDEPWDWKVEFRNLMADSFGKELGEVISHGVPRALMPWDIANRVSLGDLWVRDSGRVGDNPREAFANDMATIMGPTAGTILGWYTAADHMQRGNYTKAVESIVPKFIRDPLKAAREAGGGVTSYSGEPLLDVGAAETMGQLLGFSPSRRSEMYAARGAVNEAKVAVDEKRQALLSKLVKARLDKDAAEFNRLQREAVEWNRRNPETRITPMHIRQSIAARMRNRARTVGGVTLPASRESLRDRGRFASVE